MGAHPAVYAGSAGHRGVKRTPLPPRQGGRFFGGTNVGLVGTGVLTCPPKRKETIQKDDLSLCWHLPILPVPLRRSAAPKSVKYAWRFRQPPLDCVKPSYLRAWTIPPSTVPYPLSCLLYFIWLEACSSKINNLRRRTKTPQTKVWGVSFVLAPTYLTGPLPAKYCRHE